MEFELENNYLIIRNHNYYIGTIIEDEDIAFFKNLLDNLDNKKYANGQLMYRNWTYWDQMLMYSVNDEGYDKFGMCITDHNFIKKICEEIIKL